MHNPVEVAALVALGFYFLPTLIAILGRHHNRFGVFALNLLVGWTLVGWSAALIWSTQRHPRPIVVTFETPGRKTVPILRGHTDTIEWR